LTSPKDSFILRAAMKMLTRLITLSFIPPLHALGLFVLRLWLGLSILLLHGWDKVMNFGATAGKFTEMGIPYIFAVGAILAESVGAVLLILGLAGRWAAAVLAVTMGVAFVHAHQMALKGPMSGELAFIYCAGFVALFLTGPGRFSADAKLSQQQH
jgi:putative oxidoreductase